MRPGAAHGQRPLRRLPGALVRPGRGLRGQPAAQPPGLGQPPGLPRQHVRGPAVRPGLPDDEKSPGDAGRRGAGHRRPGGPGGLSRGEGAHGPDAGDLYRLHHPLPDLHRRRVHSGGAPGIRPAKKRSPERHALRPGAVNSTQQEAL